MRRAIAFWSCLATVMVSIAPLVALYAPLGMAVVLGVLGVSAAVAFWRVRPWRSVPSVFPILLSAVFAWQMFSLLWTGDILQALRSSVAMLSTAAAGICLIGAVHHLDGAQCRRLANALLGGLLAAAVCVVGERLSGYALLRAIHHLADPFYAAFMFKRGGTVLALLVWPVLWGCWARGWKLAGAAMVAVGVIAVAATGGDTAAAALALAIAMAVPCVLWGRRFLPVIGVMMAAAVLIMPVATRHIPGPQELWDTFPGMPSSLHHRLTIWRFSAQSAEEHWLRGWGMDASRWIPGAEEYIPSVGVLPDGRKFEAMETALPLHPHNAPLQWWLELGLPGVLLGAMFLAELGRRAKAAVGDRAEAAFAGGLLATGFMVSLASYGAWQSWWVSSLWFAAALAVAARRAGK